MQESSQQVLISASNQQSLDLQIDDIKFDYVTQISCEVAILLPGKEIVIGKKSFIFVAAQSGKEYSSQTLIVLVYHNAVRDILYRIHLQRLFDQFVNFKISYGLC